MTARLCVTVISALFMAAALAAGAEPSPQAAKAWAQCQKEVGSAKVRSDFDAARSALRSFVERYPEHPETAGAREEIKTITPAADKQLNGIWSSAESMSQRKRYDMALELYTELLTRNSSAEWTTKAKEAIERNDAAAGETFAKNKKAADEAFAAWNFTEAAKQAARGHDELVGTKWAEPASRLEKENEAVRQLFAGLITKVKATGGAPKKTPFQLPDLSGWNVKADINGVDEQKMSVTVNGAGRDLFWKDMTPDRMLELFNVYGVTPADHFAMGILFLRTGKKDAAALRFMSARASEELFDSAEYYLKVLAGKLNLLSYDFSQGLQILDWEGRGGRWLIIKGELVQESADGEGELVLVKQGCKTKELRLNFDLIDRGGKGGISVVLVQDAQNMFGFTFSREDGYSAFASVDGKVTTVKEASFKLETDKRVQIRCGLKGDEFGLSVGNTKLPRLSVAGISKFESAKITLKTIDCKAVFDNIEAVNRSE